MCDNPMTMGDYYPTKIDIDTYEEVVKENDDLKEKIEDLEIELSDFKEVKEAYRLLRIKADNLEKELKNSKVK